MRRSQQCIELGTSQPHALLEASVIETQLLNNLKPGHVTFGVNTPQNVKMYWLYTLFLPVSDAQMAPVPLLLHVSPVPTCSWSVLL